jgi:hypothetical protein
MGELDKVHMSLSFLSRSTMYARIHPYPDSFAHNTEKLLRTIPTPRVVGSVV